MSNFLEDDVCVAVPADKASGCRFLLGGQSNANTQSSCSGMRPMAAVSQQGPSPTKQQSQQAQVQLQQVPGPPAWCAASCAGSQRCAGCPCCCESCPGWQCSPRPRQQAGGRAQSWASPAQLQAQHRRKGFSRNGEGCSQPVTPVAVVNPSAGSFCPLHHIKW